MITIEKGKMTIYDEFGQDGNIILDAGTTCYKSKDTTKKTVIEFIEMFRKLKHLSMLEFSWFILEFKYGDIKKLEYLILHQHYLRSTRFINDCGEDILIVSGNSRAWSEFLEKVQYASEYEEEFSLMAQTLFEKNPHLFPYAINRANFSYSCTIIEKTHIKGTTNILRDIHDWICVKFEDVSRGFCNELVRHRTFSFAAASSRYISYDDFNIVFPLDTLKNDGFFNEEYISYIDDYIKSCKAIYKSTLALGLKKDYARQFLPLGLANEIMVAGRASDWQHAFDLRCTSAAHWEIRILMEELRERLNVQHKYAFT